MILVGHYDSPFVRRVAVALHLYGLPFERRALSAFRDFDAVLAISPLDRDRPGCFHPGRGSPAQQTPGAVPPGHSHAETGLGKVAVLLLDDGEPLFDSRAILDHLDSLVGPDARLLPKAEPDRRRVLAAISCRVLAAIS